MSEVYRVSLLLFGVLLGSPVLVGQQLNAPSGARADMIDMTSLSISWVDNSDNETGFLIYTVVNGQLGEALGTVPANQTQVTLTGLEPGSGFQFAIFAYIQDPETFSSPSVTGFVELAYYFYRYGFGGLVGQPLDALLELSGSPSQITVQGLPDWAAFDAGTRRFTGFPTSAGVFTFSVSAVYPDMTITDEFSFRVLPAPSGPVQTATIPREALDVNLFGGVQEVDLGNYFDDPDTPAAVVLEFDQIGEVGIVLYEDAAPATVANFIAYTVTEGKGGYDGTMIHRSIPGFIIQGGGYRPLGGIAFESITDQAPVVNEPGLENIRGTLAMAKLGGNPDSATNEWFVNLGDNRGNLDYQNEGFSVFGRVAGNGMDVFDFIEGLPIGGYNTITVDGGSRPGLMSDTPVLAESAPSSMDQSLLVKINRAKVVNPLAYEIVSMSHPSVAQVTLDGDVLKIEPLSMGWSELTFAMSDLDGNRIERTVAVTVHIDYASWADEAGKPDQPEGQSPLPAEFSGPLDDPDADGMPNLVEFALATNPMDYVPNWPTPNVYEVSNTPYLTLSCATYKRANGVVLSLQAKDASATDWETIWTSANGTSHPVVVSYQESGDYAFWILRDTVSADVSPARLLRMTVSEGP